MTLIRTMTLIQHLVGPSALPSLGSDSLSVLSYNVLLPNSVDGWWNYKMYHPPLTGDRLQCSTWAYRRDLLRERIATVGKLDADIVCLQEVSPVSFADDFDYMKDLGYDGQEMFRKGRFRPATFWKSSQVELASPPAHKDRTLLTAFRRRRPPPSLHSRNDPDPTPHTASRVWYVLNVHLQAGREGSRRLRQINEGVRAVLTMARKLKEQDPETNVLMIACGDFNGGQECAAIRFLEDGYVDATFREDGEAVTSNRKNLPLTHPLLDVMTVVDRPPPSTLVVAELISNLIQSGTSAYENPQLSHGMLQRLERIFASFAQHEIAIGEKVMNVSDVERWLIAINGQVGRGSEFRAAVRLMTGKAEETTGAAEPTEAEGVADEFNAKDACLPQDGVLTREGFDLIYQEELEAGKFWGIAYDMTILGHPLPDAGIFQSRYDRIYCSSALCPTAVMDFTSDKPCPNDREPSDHLPVAASFTIK